MSGGKVKMNSNKVMIKNAKLNPIRQRHYVVLNAK